MDKNKQLHFEMIKTILPVVQQLGEKYNPFPKFDLAQKPINEIKLQQQTDKFSEIIDNIEKKGNKIPDELKLLLMISANSEKN
jgi:hypothetical protein